MTHREDDDDTDDDNNNDNDDSDIFFCQSWYASKNSFQHLRFSWHLTCFQRLLVNSHIDSFSLINSKYNYLIDT